MALRAAPGSDTGRPQLPHSRVPKMLNRILAHVSRHHPCHTPGQHAAQISHLRRAPTTSHPLPVNVQIGYLRALPMGSGYVLGFPS